METVLRINFKEVVRRVGYRPGNDAREDRGGMALISSAIDTGHLDITPLPRGMIGHPPGYVKRGTALISSLWGVVAVHSDTVDPLVPVGHLVLEEKVAAFLDAVI